jgi:Kelch motif
MIAGGSSLRRIRDAFFAIGPSTYEFKRIGGVPMKANFSLVLVSLLLVGVVPVAVAQTPNIWSSGAPIPTAVYGPAVAVLNGEIYVIGGTNADNAIIADTQIYDPATNSWSTGVSLPTPVEGASAAAVKGIIYVMGGTTSGGVYNYTDAVWALAPVTQTWYRRAAMPTALHDAGIAVEGNIIYVIGGNSNSNLRADTVESFNPATDTWTEEAPLLVGKSEPTVGLVGATIVAADGLTQTTDTGDNEGYDVSTNTWTSLTSDPTPRSGACGGRIGARLYVAGGFYGSSPALQLAKFFTLSTNAWKKFPPMPQAALFQGSAVYQGNLYCFGGQNAFDGTVLNNVQIYQP